MATAGAYKEVLWLRVLVSTFGIIHDSVQVYYDSQFDTYQRITGITS